MMSNVIIGKSRIVIYLSIPSICSSYGFCPFIIHFLNDIVFLRIIFLLNIFVGMFQQHFIESTTFHAA